MNIFYLSHSPKLAAEYHCDKHCVKMILEAAQLLSTAHRVLDGEQYTELTESNRRIKRWKHPNVDFENNLYKATHINHPSAVWVRESETHYVWLYRHFLCLMAEYTKRYGKIHACTKMVSLLEIVPTNIPKTQFKFPPQAMPDDVKDSDTVTAYRNYYMVYKRDISKWKSGCVPEWYK